MTPARFAAFAFAVLATVGVVALLGPPPVAGPVMLTPAEVRP